MQTASSTLLDQNLGHLTGPARQALQAGPNQPSIRVDAPGPVMRASVQTPDGRWVDVHAASDPVRVCEQILDRFSTPTPPPLMVVVGLGLGYMLDALEARGAETRVLALEPVPAITRAMLERRDWSRWLVSGQLTLLVGPDYTGAAEAWRLFRPGGARPPVISSPLLDREFPREAASASTVAKRVLSGVQANEVARKQFAGRYLLNTLRNLPAITTEGDAAALTGAFAEIPAIVVGAGPSLDRHLAEIRQLQGRALIIAVDTAMRPLLAAGISPHLVVAVDPSEANGRHLRELPDTRGTWLVTEGSLDPAVLSQFAHRMFTFRVSDHHPWPWLASLGSGRGQLRAWGSVLTTSFDLALQAGCNPVIFAGADLAYSDGLQYCRNTVYEPEWRDCETNEARAERFKVYLAQHPPLSEPDVHGRPVLTTPHYGQFRDWIVARAGEAAGRHVVNATGAGILRGGPIEQSDTILPHVGTHLDDQDLFDRLLTAWRSGHEARAHAVDRVAAALASGADLPLEDWMAFGGDTASADDVGRALTTAHAALTARVREDAARARAQVRVAQQATSLDQARAAIHPDYDFAAEQASAQQAALILEHMRRIRAVQPGDPVPLTTRAAAVMPAALNVLDVGCGLGRMMTPLVQAGHHVDGVDFSADMIALARQDPRLAGSHFYTSSGTDCGGARDGHYDLVCAYHMLHMVPARPTRVALLRAMARALRPGGTLLIQLPFHPDSTMAAIPAPHLAWDAEAPDSEAPGESQMRVFLTPDQLPMLYADLSRDFKDVQLQFVDFTPDTRRFDGRVARLSHLLISASASHTLAERIYAPLTRRDMK